MDNNNTRNNAANTAPRSTMREVCFGRANIKVLMIGARRVGKSSIIATMLSDRCRDIAVRNTDLLLELREEGQEEKVARLRSTERMMINYFDPNVEIPKNENDTETDTTSSIGRDAYTTFKLDAGASREEVDINLTLRTQTRNGVYQVQFIDIPGEWINNYNAGIPDGDRQQLQNLVAAADVIMVTIDSVLLVEDAGSNALTGNRVENVTKIIQENYNRQCENPKKLIMFVPVKCEKYYNRHMELVNYPEKFYDTEDPMTVLMTQVKRVYAPLLRWCADEANGNALNLDVAILPVMTLGNIQYSHIDVSKTKATYDNSDVYYTYYKQFTGTYDDDFTVPEYAPAYCEQPLIMILLYQLEKIRRLKQNRNVWTTLLTRFLGIFGGLASDDALLDNIPFLRRNLAVNQKGYLSEFLQSPITNADTRIVQE